MSDPHVFLSHSWSEHKLGSVVTKVKTWLSDTSQMPSIQLVDRDTGLIRSRPLVAEGERLGQYVIIEGTNPISGSQRQVREKILEQVSSTDLVILLVDQHTMESNYIAWEILCARFFVKPAIPVFGIQYSGMVFDPYEPGSFPIERQMFSYVTFVGDDFIDAGALMQEVEGILWCERKAGHLFLGKQREIQNRIVDKLINVDNLSDCFRRQYRKQCTVCGNKFHILLAACPKCGNRLITSPKSIEDAKELVEGLRIQEESAMHVDRGGELYESGEYDEAENEFKKAIEINPMNVHAHGNMGCIFLRRGQPEKAVKWFEKALALNPHYEGGEVMLERAKALIKEKRSKQ